MTLNKDSDALAPPPNYALERVIRYAEDHIRDMLWGGSLVFYPAEVLHDRIHPDAVVDTVVASFPEGWYSTFVRSVREHTDDPALSGAHAEVWLRNYLRTRIEPLRHELIADMDRVIVRIRTTGMEVHPKRPASNDPSLSSELNAPW